MKPAHLLLLAFALVTGSCVNPFSPRLENADILEDILGNPTTIEGFYTRFQNAYQLRDTTLYGPLIASEFIFTYRDPELNVDVSWGRAEELNTTARLFSTSRDIQLQWNNISSFFQNEPKTRAQVIRRFNLMVMLDESTVYRTDGATNFILTRDDSTRAWQLLSWRDESEL
jgi:hypothetical protein